MRCRRLTEKRLGQIFKDKGLVSDFEIDKALQMQKENEGRCSIGSALMALGFLREEHIVQGVVSQYRIPYLPADRYEVDPHAAALVPLEMARAHTFIPVERLGNALTVLMADPFQAGLIEKIEALCQMAVHVAISTPSEINKALDRLEKYPLAQPFSGN